MSRLTERDFWIGLIIGAALIIIWFAATKTTLLLAYGHQNAPLTLSQAQGACDSSLGLIARNMSAQGAANCASVDRYAMWLSVTGFAGLMLALTSIGALAYRKRHTAAPAAPLR